MTNSATTLTASIGTVGTDQSVALVTGAAGTMGVAIAQRHTRAGMALVMVDINAQGAEEAAHQVGATGHVIQADLMRKEAASEIMAIVRQQVGRLNHLVNNAGLNRPQTIYHVDPDDWDAVLAVNLRAPMMLAKMTIPFWEDSPGGAIVNIGSRVWLSGSIPAYTASKAGIVGLTRSLAIELARLNIRCNAVAPSYVDTAFTRMDRSAEDIAQRKESVARITPLPHLGTAEDIANAVNFFLSPEASFITGEILHVCGGAQLAAVSYPFVTREAASAA